MKTRIKYLNEYLDEMKSQMEMFRNVNQDLLKLYQGRMVRVTDSYGFIVQGLFKGFSVKLEIQGDKSIPIMYIHLQLIKKDGTPTNRERMVNCKDAYIRLLGQLPRRDKTKT